MSKSIRKEVSHLLPTSKRLSIIHKKSLDRMEVVCNLNNECYELIEKEKEIKGAYNATNITMIRDNLSYMIKYAESLSRMHTEISESCKAVKEVLGCGQGKYMCPLLLRWRLKRTIYVGNLLMNVISEICNIHQQASEDFEVLLKNKMKEIGVKEEN